MLSLMGWIFGLQALIYLVVSCSSGIIFIILARKSNAKLLFYFGVYAIFLGFWQLSGTLEFLIFIVTGNDPNFPILYFFFLAWIWPYLAGLILLYIILELLII